MTQLKVGVVGMGYWGPKLARCFDELGVLAAICDKDSERTIHKSFGKARCYVDLSEMLPDCDAVTIATPPETHYALANFALSMGKHVFVEKPLATSYKEARELELLAQKNHLALAVGHIYLHCPGLMAIPVPIGSADLYVSLLNEAGPPSDSTRDLMWAGFPHAVSIALHFFPEWPVKITTIPDRHRIQARLDYFNGSRAFLDVADFVGVKRRAVELRVGDRCFEYYGDTPNKHYSTQGTYEDSGKEPLLAECEAFLKAVEQKAVDPLGAKVVAMVEAMRGGAKCLNPPFR